MTQSGHEDMSYITPPHSLYHKFGMNFNVVQSTTDCIGCKEEDNLVKGKKDKKHPYLIGL
jgi:hypothetical protein